MLYAVRPGLPESPTTAQVSVSSRSVRIVSGSCQSAMRPSCPMGPPGNGVVTRKYDPGMSSDFPLYALSEEHQAIREAVRAVCDAKVAPYAADVDENARYPREAAAALLAADFHAPHVPEEYGGAGADALATVIVIEEVARACVSSSLIPAVNKLGSLPVQIAGSEELKKKYLGKLAGRRGRLLLLPLRARRRLRRGTA